MSFEKQSCSIVSTTNTLGLGTELENNDDSKVMFKDTLKSQKGHHHLHLGSVVTQVKQVTYKENKMTS
jgi:hypothetical protein